MDYFVHESSYIDEPCSIGRCTKIWRFCHIMPGAVIGEDCNLGQNVVVLDGVKIGSRVRIQNNVSVYAGVECEEDVFLGTPCVFTNAYNPRAFIARKAEYRRTLIKKGATIGANATVVCGVTTGRYAFVGAGLVATRDVPDFALIYGNPAKVRGYMCKCGIKLELGEHKARCPACGLEYARVGAAIMEQAVVE